MDVADEIVVLAGGVVELVGSPHEVYDNPANPFVMSFLGPVTRLDGHLVRPHDIEVSATEQPRGDRGPGGPARVRGPDRDPGRRRGRLGAGHPGLRRAPDPGSGRHRV